MGAFKMGVVTSILSRFQSVKDTIKSRYWEYAKYFSDDVLWETTILFESFGGNNFQGNPFYVFKEIYESKEYSIYTLLVAHRTPEKLKEFLETQGLFDERVRIIEKDSVEYRNALAHSKYLVNNVSFNMDFIKKEQQVYLNTWHGTPLKCLGRNIQNDPFECNNAQRNFLLSDYLLAPNVPTKKVFENDYMVSGIMPGEIVLKGYPRNTIFFDDEARSAVKGRYHLEGVTSILYMPTWRGTACGVDEVDQVREIEQLAKDLGTKYKVYVKFHPAMQKRGVEFEYCHSVPNDLEIYQFLNAMDILITDYSSVFFDFACSEQRIILYQYDKDEYFRARGIYEKVEEKIPFPIARCYQELLANVRDNHTMNCKDFVELFCPRDNIFASKEIAETLLYSEMQQELGCAVDLYVIDYEITEKEMLRLKEKLKDANYRFVFLLNRRTRELSRLQCFNEIEYLVLYPYDRLKVSERLLNWIFGMWYRMFRCKRALEVMQGYAIREQRRLWGGMKIDHIYAKSRALPTAVKVFARDWPENL